MEKSGKSHGKSMLKKRGHPETSLVFMLQKWSSEEEVTNMAIFELPPTQSMINFGSYFNQTRSSRGSVVKMTDFHPVNLGSTPAGTMFHIGARASFIPGGLGC